MKFTALLALASATQLHSHSHTAAETRAQIQELSETFEKLEQLQKAQEENDFDWGNLLSRGKTIAQNLLRKF